MTCYRCGGSDLPLAPLSEWERILYHQAGIVLRRCRSCGLEQNHVGVDETLSPLVAMQEAPDRPE